MLRGLPSWQALRTYLQFYYFDCLWIVINQVFNEKWGKLIHEKHVMKKNTLRVLTYFVHKKLRQNVTVFNKYFTVSFVKMMIYLVLYK